MRIAANRNSTLVTRPHRPYRRLNGTRPTTDENATVEVVERQGARVLLLDPGSRLLLLEVVMPTEGTFWITPGGEIDPGETEQQAATRELREETGIRVDPNGLVGPVWSRHHDFTWDGRRIHQSERYFLARIDGTDDFAPELSDPSEAATIRQIRWWSLDELHAADPTLLVQT